MRNLSALLFIVCLAACTPDEPEPVASVLLPDKIELEGQTKQFFHNGSNELTQIKITTYYSNDVQDEYNQFFTYQGDTLKDLTSGDWRFVYTIEDGKISRTDEYILDELSQWHTFSYYANGLLKERVSWQNIPDQGGDVPVMQDAYTYDSNKNLINHSLYHYTTNGEDTVLITSFTYSDFDNKINAEDYFEVNLFNPLVKFNTNNPGKKVTTNVNGIISSTETYTYQYHAHGYPTQKTTNYVFHSGATQTSSLTYTFKE